MRQMPNQGPPAPERIEPVPEKVKGPNFPYRGAERHGVESESEPWPEPGTEAKDNKSGITYMEPIKELDPVPVIIVSEHGRELRKWRTLSSVVGNVPTQIIGRTPGRTRLYVQNTRGFLETAPHPILRISHDASLLSIPTWGFRVMPDNWFPVETEDPVYAVAEHWTDNSWDVPVVVLEEYRIEA